MCVCFCVFVFFLSYASAFVLSVRGFWCGSMYVHGVYITLSESYEFRKQNGSVAHAVSVYVL